MSDPVDAGPLLPECEFADDIPRDAQGCLPVGALVATTHAGCRIPDGECFTIYNPDTAFNTRSKENPVTKPAAAPVAVPVDDAPAEAPAEDKAAPLAGPPTAPVAHVTEAPSPATAVAELQALLPKDGSGGTGITVILTLIAVGGGGAAWKFYQSFAKQKHEQRMKELEIKEKKIELQDDKNDHKTCELARANDRAAWEAKVAALESRLAESEKRAAEVAQAAKSPEFTFDIDEVEQRLAEVEKALKKAPNEKKKPKKS